MSTALATTIQKDIHEGVRVEYPIVAGLATLKPGHFVRTVDVSGVTRVNVQSTSAGEDPVMLVHTDRFQGDHTVGGGVDQVYLANAVAFIEYPPRGALRYVRVATGQTVIKGSQLMFNGAAALILATGTLPKIVAIAEEVITTSGEQLVLARIA